MEFDGNDTTLSFSHAALDVDGKKGYTLCSRA